MTSGQRLNLQIRIYCIKLLFDNGMWLSLSAALVCVLWEGLQCVYGGAVPSVPYILPMCAEHGCLLPPGPGPMCTLFPFSEDSFLLSFQLLLPLLCQPSFSCMFLIPLYFTSSCVCVSQLYFRRVLCSLLLIL